MSDKWGDTEANEALPNPDHEADAVMAEIERKVAEERANQPKREPTMIEQRQAQPSSQRRSIVVER